DDRGDRHRRDERHGPRWSQAAAKREQHDEEQSGREETSRLRREACGAQDEAGGDARAKAMHPSRGQKSEGGHVAQGREKVDLEHRPAELEEAWFECGFEDEEYEDYMRPG